MKSFTAFCFSSTSVGIFGLDMLVAAMNFINHSHHTLKGCALNLSHNWYLKQQICDSNWSSYSMTIIWFPYLLGRLIYEHFSYCLKYLFVRTWVYQTLCSGYHYTRTVCKFNLYPCHKMSDLKGTKGSYCALSQVSST